MILRPVYELAVSPFIWTVVCSCHLVQSRVNFTAGQQIMRAQTSFPVKQTNRQTDRQTNKQTNKQFSRRDRAPRQNHRRTDRQDRHGLARPSGAWLRSSVCLFVCLLVCLFVCLFDTLPRQPAEKMYFAPADLLPFCGHHVSLSKH